MDTVHHGQAFKLTIAAAHQPIMFGYLGVNSVQQGCSCAHAFFFSRWRILGTMITALDAPVENGRTGEGRSAVLRQLSDDLRAALLANDGAVQAQVIIAHIAPVLAGIVLVIDAAALVLIVQS